MPIKETLADRVVVIAGGAGLLGRNFARCVAEHGGLAVIADLDETAAARVAAPLADRFPGRVTAHRLDITDRASIDALVDVTHGNHDRIDALVNSAYPRNPEYGRKLEDVSYAGFCDNVGMHLGGYFHTAQRFAEYFRRQGHGNIVNLGSIYGSLAPRFEVYAGTAMTMPVEYAAIKSGIIQLTRYFAQYFKADGIRVNCLSPGGIFDQQPEPFLERYRSHCGSKGMLDPDDLDGTLLYLLSDASRHVTGQDFIVDDGYTL